MALHRSLFLPCLLFCLPSFCQIGSGVGGTFTSVSSISSIGNVRTGLPYSAEFVITRVQTLADGTQITTHQGKQFEARDSAGRTRHEMYMPERPLGSHRDSDQPIFVTISDPVAGQAIHLDPRQKTATVTPFPIMHANQSAPKSQQTAPVRTLPQPELLHSSVEKLGEESIGGVNAEGRRITRLIPAGTEGNDRDFTVITERWESSELGVEVLDTITDPRTGVTTKEVKNLTRAEPDPALFQIPADYKLQAPQHPNQDHP